MGFRAVTPGNAANQHHPDEHLGAGTSGDVKSAHARSLRRGYLVRARGLSSIAIRRFIEQNRYAVKFEALPLPTPSPNL